MIGPLFKYGYLGHFCSLMVAVVIGFWFGFLLERAGFGNARKLANIFYFKDFAVLKVMFTAIVVAMLGLLYFSMFGWIDYSRMYILPTYVGPHIVGGLLLGIGFVMGGYCPTTSIVAMVSGKLDGFLFIMGMMFGVFLFAESFPLIEGFYNSGSKGVVRLPDVLHLSSGAVALLVCLMAVGAFFAGEKAEKKFQDFEPVGLPSRRFKFVGSAFLLVAGLVIAVSNPDSVIINREKTETTVKKEAIEPFAGSKTLDLIKDDSESHYEDDEGC